MININHISAQKMIQAEDGVQKQVYQKLKQANPTFSPTQDDAVAVAEEFLIDGLEKGSISLKELMLMMIEQGNLSVTEEEKASIENGASPTAFIIKKLSNGEMSPADTGLDPASGLCFRDTDWHGVRCLRASPTLPMTTTSWSIRLITLTIMTYCRTATPHWSTVR